MIEVNNLPEELELFLKKHDVLHQYRVNSANIGRGVLKIKHKDSWIDGAFTWDDTKEGEDLWIRIDNLWSRHLRDTNGRHQ